MLTTVYWGKAVGEDEDHTTSKLASPTPCCMRGTETKQRAVGKGKPCGLSEAKQPCFVPSTEFILKNTKKLPTLRL